MKHIPSRMFKNIGMTIVLLASSGLKGTLFNSIGGGGMGGLFWLTT